jgi:hypothetical protein
MQESLRLMVRSRLQQHRLAWARKFSNLLEEEVKVLKHIQGRGDIRMNKLGKNLGVVIYTLQREKKAIKLHLQSSNFALAQDDRQLHLHNRRKEIWDNILEQAHQMFEDIDMPKELGECLLQLVPHLPGRLNHMYVMWKITAGKTRPIVPSYASYSFGGAMGSRTTLPVHEGYSHCMS